MTLSTLISKIRLAFKDPNEEKEYFALKIPLLKGFFTCLFLCIALYLIPVCFRYFQKDLFPQSYIAIGILVLSFIIFFFRKRLTGWLESLSIAIVVTILSLAIINVRQILGPSHSYEAFYMGYLNSLVHRIIDYRVVKFKVVVAFNLLFLILKFSFIQTNDGILIANIVCLEFFPIIITFITEKGDRELFDSLYKSKNQLLKFKQILTEYFPNQMAIFSTDYSSCYFMNDSFKKTFLHNTIEELKNLLEKFVIQDEDIDKNLEFFCELGYIKSDQPLRLSTFMEHIAKNKTNALKSFQDISFQVHEEIVVENEADHQPGNENLNTDGDAQISKNGLSSQNKLIITQESRKNTPKTQKVTFNLNLNEKIDSQSNAFVQVTSRQDNDRKPIIEEVNDDDSKSSDFDKRRIFKVKVFCSPWDNQEALAIILDDVTHERTILELKIADKNKDLVIATVSHELRTPLNGMLGLINIIEQNLKQSDISPYLNACKHSCLLLLSLVNSMLDLSLMKKNKLRLNISEVSLPSLLSEAKALFDFFCLSKNLYLNIDIDPKVPNSIITDSGRLTQILVNLLGNAFKFTFKGGITVKVRVEGQTYTRIKFIVEDTGIGIRKEDQARLFKMFGKIDHKDKTINTNGVGLGLTISNSLAELLNPSDKKGIEVKSEFGKGSIFSFCIEPLQKENGEEVEQKSYEGQETTVMDENTGQISVFERITAYNEARNKNTKLEVIVSESEEPKAIVQKEKPLCLIVDDNPFNLIVANHLMQERGYFVFNALNGKEAIQLVQEKEKNGKILDLILMDCQMPVMDGYEATRILKNLMKEGKINECPIVALTANSRSEKHEELYTEVGMDGYIAKPLQIKELVEVLKEVQKRKKKRREISLLNNERGN